MYQAWPSYGRTMHETSSKLQKKDVSVKKVYQAKEETMELMDNFKFLNEDAFAVTRRIPEEARILLMKAEIY